MELMPQDIAAQMPRLKSQDELGEDARVVVKYFTPDGGWTWFVTEGDPVGEGDWELFGLVKSPQMPEGELGYFLLSKLRESRGPLGLPIERDLFWRTKTLRECRGEGTDR
jgi:hypothetical protein